ncbi:MAG: ABC transporter ATP-binding protein [Candidatus Eisenbacteria bacterium]|nr:ABC transporter ATP-binding protein [Candidatus Eisenbacteria bacterium]MCC7142312.1 ABC transporter ATP-binding protein [Candidatus Eisenbacteria bacterium]
MTEEPILRLRQVSKSYAQDGGERRFALRSASLDVPRGRKIAIIGRSGSGKSTLLHLAAGIDLPTEGTVEIAGQDVGRMNDRERTLLRRDAVGLVFQFFYLLPHLNVRDNVALPSLIAGAPWREIEARARELLTRVGLEDRALDSAQKLSGGEMQRVAICRALLRRPGLLLADEPTGNLDDENGRAVMDLLLSLVDAEGSTLVYVTHSLELAGLADEVWRLHSGLLERA